MLFFYSFSILKGVSQTCWVELKVQDPLDLRVQGSPHCPALYSAFSDSTLGRGREERGEDR